MSLKKAAILLFAFWALAFLGTHLPGNAIRSYSFPIPNLDKIVHFGMFFVLAGLLANAISRRVERWLPISLYTALLATSYAAFDEITQMYVPNRSCEFLDFVADLSGVVVGISAFHVGRQVKRLLASQRGTKIETGSV